LRLQKLELTELEVGTVLSLLREKLDFERKYGGDTLDIMWLASMTSKIEKQVEETVAARSEYEIQRLKHG
jgi:hypothetical protein